MPSDYRPPVRRVGLQKVQSRTLPHEPLILVLTVASLYQFDVSGM